MSAPLTEPPGLSVAIVGAGIAGLTLTLGLQSRGVSQVRIYERGSSLREIGAGIGFTPNAERAMKLLDARIHAAFRRVTVQNGTDWFAWVDGSVDRDGTPIHRMYLGERGFEGCARADFLDELVRLAPEDTVEFGKNLVAVRDGNGEEESGRVRLEFEDGTFAEADAVIGCDGIRSKIRHHVIDDLHAAARQPGYTEKYAFRGLIPMDVALNALGQAKTDTRHMYLGPDGHALTFPVAGGRLLNVVAFASDKGGTWPDNGRFTAPASRADAEAAFASFGPTVRAIIGMLPEELSKWAVFDTLDHPAPTFVNDRVCIAGDAAHAAAPYHGAGAGFAIEDGAVLAWLLAEVDSQIREGSGDRDDERPRGQLVREALKTYDAVRLERAHWIVETSRFIGDMYEWQDPRVGSDHALCAEEIDWRCRKIWHYDVDGMMMETKEQFEKQIGKLGV